MLWCFLVTFGLFKALQRLLKNLRPIRLYHTVLSLLEAVLGCFEAFQAV